MTRNHSLKFRCLMEWLQSINKARKTSRGWELISNDKEET